MFDTNSWQLEDITFILNEYSELVRWGFRDETVLHFGCGSGFITGKFLLPHLPRGVRVVGVEENHDLVEFAKKYHQNDMVEYRKLKEIKDCVFDHILLFYYFKDNLNHFKLFHTLNEHLSNNGDLLMILLNNHSVLTIMQNLQLNEKYKGKLGKLKIHPLNMEIASLQESMTDAKFTKIICKCYERYHVFPNKNVLRSFLINNLEDMQMTKDEFNEFFEDFMELMRKQTDMRHIGRKKNVICVPYTLTFLYGKKLSINKR